VVRCERSDWELVSTAAFAANCANLEVWPSWVDSPARKTLLSLRTPTPMSPSETINACAALKELCGKLNDPAPSVVWAGGVHAALGWMCRHTRHANVVAECWRAITACLSGCARCTAVYLQTAARVVSTEAPNMAICCMVTFPTSVDVTLTSMEFLHKAAQSHTIDAMPSQLRHRAAIECAMGMSRHVFVKKIMWTGILCLRYLTTDEGEQLPVTDLQGIELAEILMAAMIAHPEPDGNVLYHAILLMLKLCTTTRVNLIRARNARAKDTVLTAIVAFEKVKEARSYELERASLLLRMLDGTEPGYEKPPGGPAEVRPKKKGLSTLFVRRSLMENERSRHYYYRDRLRTSIGKPY
jgi:hypothetical protein